MPPPVFRHGGINTCNVYRDALRPMARFTGDGEIEIVADAELAASKRELYRSSFDPGTFRLSAFHCLSPGYC